MRGLLVLYLLVNLSAAPGVQLEARLCTVYIVYREGRVRGLLVLYLGSIEHSIYSQV